MDAGREGAQPDETDASARADGADRRTRKLTRFFILVGAAVLCLVVVALVVV